MASQTEIPGTEPETQATQAQRKINQPLIAKVPQKPLDFGLFGDEREQLDLINLTRSDQ